MIFGSLVSLISAGAYAAADEIRVAHKIRSYQPTMPRDTSFDTSREYRLKDVFRRNWDHEGATLFPPKMIPFLASDEEIRDLWIEATVWQIMGKEPPNSNLRGRKRYLKFDGGWYGPQLYEYDFVARYHPEDWAKYKRYKVEQKKQAEENYNLHKRRITLHVLIITLLALIGIALILFGWNLAFADQILGKFMLVTGVLLIGGCVIAGFSAYWVREDHLSKMSSEITRRIF